MAVNPFTMQQTENPFFDPANLLMMAGGMLQAPNFAQGAGNSLATLGQNVAVAKEKQTEKQQENATRAALQKLYPDQDLSALQGPDLHALLVETQKRKMFPAAPEFKSLADGTYGTWDGSKFNVLGKAENPADLPAAYQDYLLQQRDPAYKAAKEEELRQKNAPTQQDNFKTTLDTMKTYRSEDAVKTYTATRDAYEKVRTNATLGTAQGDIGLVYGFMKMLDPTSVVREGEYATAQNSGGVSDTVINLYNKVIDGQRLTPEQRQQFVEAAAAQYDNTVKNLGPVNKRYSDLANDYGVPTDRVLEQPKTYEPLKLNPGQRVEKVINGKKVTIEKVSE